MNTLIGLNKLESRVLPAEKLVKPYELLAPESLANIPWHQALSRRQYKEFVDHLMTIAKTSLDDNDNLRYYKTTWRPASELLASLSSACVDIEGVQHVIASGDGNADVLRSFLPTHDNTCNPVMYDRLKTLTGRLRVVSGPQILTLKQEHRALLRSKWGNQGHIVYVDFSNLEVRVILYESGRRCTESDLYAYVNREVFDNALERNTVKAAVISQLYGISEGSLAKKLELPVEEVKKFKTMVDGFFRTRNLRNRIKREFKKKGYITNRYGRRIDIREPLNHIFVNSYAQSTGVDVALMGFHEIMKDFETDKVSPLFVLHDALIVDCHDDELQRLLETQHVHVPGYVQEFRLTTKLL